MADRDKPADIPTVFGMFSPSPGIPRPGASSPGLGLGSCDRSPGRTARQTGTWGRTKQSLDDVSEMLDFTTSPVVSRSPIIYIMSTNVSTAPLVPVQLKAVPIYPASSMVNASHDKIGSLAPTRTVWRRANTARIRSRFNR